MDITGPDRDFHSGSFGGGIDNPLNVVGHIIAKLKDENGRILIPGFYDKVRPLSPMNVKFCANFHWMKPAGCKKPVRRKLGRA